MALRHKDGVREEFSCIDALNLKTILSICINTIAKKTGRKMTKKTSCGQFYFVICCCIMFSGIFFLWCAVKGFWLHSLLILKGKPLIPSLLMYTYIDKHAYAYKFTYTIDLPNQTTALAKTLFCPMNKIACLSI